MAFRVLARAIARITAYRMQELAYGGLSKATQRKLDALTKELQVKGSIVVTPDASLRPGTRLVREWRGRHCHVNRKFADQMTMAVTVHAATVAWRPGRAPVPVQIHPSPLRARKR